MSDYQKKKDAFWDTLVLLPVGLVCFGYVLFKRDFAKLHLAFLKFPVFVGEVLMGICIIMVAWRLFQERPKWKAWHSLIVLYVGWLLFKVIQGYLAWGPLTLRHAALFYYPFFFTVGFMFFNRAAFTRPAIFGIFTAILGAFIWRQYDGYWTLTMVLLAVILAMKVKDKMLSGAMIVVLMALVPYYFFIGTARMMFVANALALLFIITSFFYLARIRPFIKAVIFILFVFYMLFAFYKYFVIGVSGRVFISPSTLQYYMSGIDRQIQEQRKYYHMEPRQIGLFNPEPNCLLEDLKINKGCVDLKAQVKSSYANSNYPMQTYGTTFKIESLPKIESPQRPFEKLIASSNNEILAFRIKKMQQEHFGLGPCNQIGPYWLGLDSLLAGLNIDKEDRQWRMRPNELGIDYPESVYNKLHRLRLHSMEYRLKWPKDFRYRALVAKKAASSKCDSQPRQYGSQIDPQIINRDERPLLMEWESADNIIFRLLIWRDMWEDWKSDKPLLGENLGKPLRSPSLEILHWAEIEWGRDGWIEPHNSYLNILYRAGIVGIILVVSIVGAWIWIVIQAFVKRSWVLILLSAFMLDWMVAANFLLILELPYTAIPFWMLAGMTFAYAIKR